MNISKKKQKQLYNRQKFIFCFFVIGLIIGIVLLLEGLLAPIGSTDSSIAGILKTEKINFFTLYSRINNTDYIVRSTYIYWSIALMGIIILIIDLIMAIFFLWYNSLLYKRDLNE